jgi:VanZ family protein
MSDYCVPPASRIAFRWGLAAFWLALVTWVSLDSNPPGARSLSLFARWLTDSKSAVPAIQGLLHLAIYALGAAAISLAVASTIPPLSKAWLFVIVFTFVMSVGVVMEILQDYVPNRAMDPRDLLGDLIGVLLYLGLAWIGGRGPFRPPVRGAQSEMGA